MARFLLSRDLTRYISHIKQSVNIFKARICSNNHSTVGNHRSVTFQSTRRGPCVKTTPRNSLVVAQRTLSTSNTNYGDPRTETSHSGEGEEEEDYSKRKSHPKKLKLSIAAELIYGNEEVLTDEHSRTSKVSESDELADKFETVLDELNEDSDTDSDVDFSDHEGDESEILGELHSETGEEVETDYIEELQIDHDDFLLKQELSENQENRRDESYRGMPDPNVPISKIPCHGCGALLHCQNTGIPGYMPSQIFKQVKHEERLRDHICQRCFFMKKYDMALDASVSSEEYIKIISEIKDVRALVIVVVDVTDMPNSIFPNLSELIGDKRPLFVVGNKADLLPRDGPGYLRRTEEMLVKLCHESGLSERYIKHVALVSAKTRFGVEDLVTKLMVDWGMKGHIFILGCTNVGKSTLFNALLMSDYCKETAMDYIQRATTSLWPGTTLNLLKFPIIRPAPWKLISRTKRLKQVKSAAKEEKRMRNSRDRDELGTDRPTLMGHIGRTFQSYTNVAVREEDSMGYSGPSFTFNNTTGAIQEGRVDKHSMLGHKYDETRYAKSKWCYDSPGVVNSQQIINMLTQQELSVLLSSKVIMPRTFILVPGQSMLVSGLSRIDYVQGEKAVYLTVFAAEKIPVKVHDTEKMDAFYEKHYGTDVLGIPVGDEERLSKLPALEGKEMTITGKSREESAADVLLSSIGWVSVTPWQDEAVTLLVSTPGGLGCSLRAPALLPSAVNLRGKRSRAPKGSKKRPPSYQVIPLPHITGDEYK